MREILFRGKRVDNGQWVYGDLVRHYENQRVFILTDQLAYTTIECGINRIISERYFEVIPETIGQYTGMADRNGKKIFEGGRPMQRGCNYCRVGLKRLTKGSPRNNYRYCPMCGKYLEESGKGDKHEGKGILKEHRED